jgi:dGTPase
MSEPVWDAMMELRSFLFDHVYTSDQVMHEVYKARHLIEDLFNYFVRHYDQVPAEYRALAGNDPLRAVTDHVAGMTDRYAINFFEDMFVPKSWNVNQ